MLGSLKIQVVKDSAEYLPGHLGIVQRPVRGTGRLKLEQGHCTFDTDVIAEAACTEHALQEIKIGCSHPVGIIHFVHPDVLNDPLHILAAPGQKQHSVTALIQPGSKGGNDLGETVGDVDILLGNAGFFLMNEFRVEKYIGLIKAENSSLTCNEASNRTAPISMTSIGCSLANLRPLNSMSRII